MDKINFNITEITPIEKSNLKEYDIRVILNNITLPYVIFNTDEVVPTSRFDFAEFDLFTCGCGVPGCAGFHSTVVHEKTEHSVKWTFPTDKSYNVEKLKYEFDRIEFEQTLEELRNKLFDLEKDNCYPSSLLNGDASDGDDANCEAKSSLYEAFQWQEKYYKAKQNFNNLLKEKFSQFYDKAYVFKYGDKQSNETLDFKYLICRTINQWPSPKKEKAYLKKAEAAGNAIIEFVFLQNYKPFAKMVYNSYNRFMPTNSGNNYELVMIDTFRNDLETIADLETFSLKKLNLVII